MLGWWLLVAGCEEEAGRSTCEATCEWAVACQGTEREVDAAALAGSCRSATESADPSCAGGSAPDPLAASAAGPCVAAIDAAAAAGQCEGFVGTYDELVAGLPPQECVTQGPAALAVYDAAVVSTAESGAELCQRFSETFCRRTEECVLGDFSGSLPAQAIEALGTPFELCVARLDPQLTAPCQADDLYAAEPSRTSEPNAPRQFARECLRDFSSVSCEALFAGELSETCAGAFTTPEQALAVAETLYGVSQEFAEYAP